MSDIDFLAETAYATGIDPVDLRDGSRHPVSRRYLAGCP